MESTWRCGSVVAKISAPSCLQPDNLIQNNRRCSRPFVAQLGDADELASAT